MLARPRRCREIPHRRREFPGTPISRLASYFTKNISEDCRSEKSAGRSSNFQSICFERFANVTAALQFSTVLLKTLWKNIQRVLKSLTITRFIPVCTISVQSLPFSMWNNSIFILACVVSVLEPQN
jgi:hypothetical protein